MTSRVEAGRHAVWARSPPTNTGSSEANGYQLCGHTREVLTLSRKNESEQELLATAIAMEGELKKYLQRVTDNPADTQDLVQTTLERVLIHGAAARVAKPEHFVRKTARNLGIDWLRQQRRNDREIVPVETADDCDLIEKPRDPFYQIAARQLLERLWPIVLQLPPRRREAFLMSREGFELEEIADRMKITVATVKVHLMQASLFIARERGALPHIDE